VSEAQSRPARLAVVSALAGTLLGSAVSLATVHYTVVSQERQQQREIDAQRDREVTAQREEVYFEFLSASNDYAVRAVDLAEVLLGSDGSVSVPGEDLAGFRAARFRFAEAYNRMFVYGSREAVTSSERVAAALPDAFVGLELDFSIAPVDEATFVLAYREFLSVACRELPARPRPSC
jgi:hypothetical protein